MDNYNEMEQENKELPKKKLSKNVHIRLVKSWE